jgi:isopentenyldiphosphate isomerase
MRESLVILVDENDKQTGVAGELEEWKAVSFNKLYEDIGLNPASYTYWFRKICLRVNETINTLIRTQ